MLDIFDRLTPEIDHFRVRRGSVAIKQMRRCVAAEKTLRTDGVWDLL